MTPLSVREALAAARNSGVEGLDAQLLLASCLDQSRSWLIAHDDTLMTPPQAERYGAWLARRAAGEPLAYLFGEKEFHGLRLQVDARVLVPRPDTETLVDWALELLVSRADSAPQVIDLGTGSGAIALAIKQANPRADVTALDASDDALAVARANATRLALDLRFRRGNWWSAVPGERFDIVISNPPYIALGDPHLAALTHEPAFALASGVDGLDALRRIIELAPAHLRQGGWLLLEHGHDQGEAVSALLLQHGFAQLESRRDLAGHLRCTGAQV